tara:strand:+ start:2408 stop:2758 length:351 start_codon:yes stop_codon:yes gene_type:complete
MRIEDIAIICYEVDQASNGVKANQISWDLLPLEMRQEFIDEVRYIHSVESITPKEWHEHWCKQKKDNGWKFSREKNTLLKVHPCIIPWEALSRKQKQRRQVFVSIVNVLRDSHDHI